ncbi:hypothetical protein Sfum_3080 [Syntrophobacter fumaroxidans MPOB]|uniref:Uncharacterized protein n=1 Tax=Syntrophobacter fumaroxidans (strain DSM 10017 / MPOB) TaxID=335543 RepID=A0LMV1_SYNFM|nr:hypothetical protein Sfum_3080 [Syntrophobacter fumaroxidans MPOB]
MRPFMAALADVSAAVRPQDLPKRPQEACLPRGDRFVGNQAGTPFRKDPKRTSAPCGRGGKIGTAGCRQKIAEQYHTEKV